MTIDFKNFFSFEQYKEIAEIELKEKNKENPNYDAIFEKQSLFSVAIIKYLKERAKKGLLIMPKNNESHYSNFLLTWNDLIKNKLEKHEEDSIEYMFDKLIMNNMMYVLNEIKGKKTTIEEGYAMIINTINNGNFSRFDLDCDSKCGGCGEKMHIVSTNWNFELLQVKYNKGCKAEVNPFPSCIENKLYEVKVEFKTGELLIADWFRIPEFTKQVEYDPNYQKLSINFDLGKINSTQHAAELGFVTIHVGNSCPTIYQQGETFMFGSSKNDNGIVKNYKNKGSVCTDLWNVTIIDKSKLIEIITQNLGEENAIKTVEEYLKKEKNNINFINIQPGEYIIGFNPQKNINKLDKEIPKDIRTLFSMKKELPKKKIKP